ncbi:hypothetical protein [Flavobacterium psychrotrophum]|uniref:hypothetical protein n=1 Tax=Flavobacterium psychrotrophum TaxID=2294119 RepID=UPI000E32367A|nr:hypothetical protein [Flavobacterium psychrotrophum]
MDEPNILLFLIKSIFIVCGLVSLFFAYKVFIKKKKNVLREVDHARNRKILKDALAGTFFFFMGCSLFACTVTGIPNYLNNRLHKPAVNNNAPVLKNPAISGGDNLLE